MWQNRITKYTEEAPDQLLVNPRNWRTHPGSQADALRGVLGDVGWVQNVIVNERTGFLIDGHLRVMEALKAGQPTIPVTWVDLSEEEEALVLATLDPLSAMAGTDAAALDALLREVSTDSPAVAQMLADLAAEAGPVLPEPGAGGDEFDATPDDGPTRTALGELWAIGGVHRLLVGDCTDPANVARLMGGERAALLWADPPFGINYTGHGASKDGRANKFTPIVGDDRPDPSWLPLLIPVEGAIYLKTTWDVLHDWEVALTEVCRLRAHIVWDRCSHSAGEVVGGYATQSEIVLFGSTGEHKTSRFDTDVWSIPRATTGAPEQRTGHPYESPVALPQRAIENSTGVGNIVLDPFLGSGTTLIAAHRTGRRCYGLELEPRYADVILRRAEAEGLTCEKVEHGS